MSREALDSALAPMIDFISTLDASDPQAADRLAERFPVDGDEVLMVAALFESGVAEGWLCDREASPEVHFSRVRKSDGQSLSIDAVRMSGAGLAHSHPAGEFDLCMAVDGDPRFDGKPNGWVVYPPGSWHVPTVEGGLMNILYFLPTGAIQFGARP